MPTYVYKYRRRYGRRYSSYRRRYYAYRRRRSRTSSTASNRGRIRVRVPVQQVIAVPVAAGSTDSSVVTSSPFVQEHPLIHRLLSVELLVLPVSCLC